MLGTSDSERATLQVPTVPGPPSHQKQSVRVESTHTWSIYGLCTRNRNCGLGYRLHIWVLGPSRERMGLKAMLLFVFQCFGGRCQEVGTWLSTNPNPNKEGDKLSIILHPCSKSLESGVNEELSQRNGLIHKICRLVILFLIT